MKGHEATWSDLTNAIFWDPKRIEATKLAGRPMVASLLSLVFLYVTFGRFSGTLSWVFFHWNFAWLAPLLAIQTWDCIDAVDRGEMIPWDQVPRVRRLAIRSMAVALGIYDIVRMHLFDPSLLYTIGYAFTLIALIALFIEYSKLPWHYTKSYMGWFRVAVRDHHGKLIWPQTSWTQRRIDESVCAQKRRKSLYIGVPMMIALILGIIYAVTATTNDTFQVRRIGWFIGLALSLRFVLPGLRDLFLEVMYRGGFQFMKGAKVLDPKPTEFGPENAGAEAFGAASITPADELAARMSGRYK